MRGKAWTDSTIQSEAEIAQDLPEDMEAEILLQIIANPTRGERMTLLEMKDKENMADIGIADTELSRILAFTAF